jgi:hypothetical protein
VLLFGGQDALFRAIALHSREWLVVRFRDPLAETVPDRVEVPLTAHCTGVKPQFDFLVKLLNLFRAQTADAWFCFHTQFGNDCGIVVGCSVRNLYRLPFGNGKHFAQCCTGYRHSGDRINSAKAYLVAVKVSFWNGAHRPRNLQRRQPTMPGSARENRRRNGSHRTHSD